MPWRVRISLIADLVNVDNHSSWSIDISRLVLLICHSYRAGPTGLSLPISKDSSMQNSNLRGPRADGTFMVKRQLTGGAGYQERLIGTELDYIEALYACVYGLPS